MKHLANMISGSRIVMAFSLFFLIGHQTMFLIIYILGWFTDAIDGTVAKLTNSQSDMGSKIDDLADLALITIMGVIMIIWVGSSILIHIPLVVIFLIVRIANMVITKQKYGKVFILHTYSEKALAIPVLLIPVVYIVFDSTMMIWIAMISGILASFEETLIHLTSESFSADRKSIFMKKA